VGGWRYLLALRKSVLRCLIINLCVGSGGADFIFIPERPPKQMPWEDELCAAIKLVSSISSFDYSVSLTYV
jgi:hypothetical protein